MLSDSATASNFLRKSRSYAYVMSGKRGPTVSSFGPISGLNPDRLMWSEMIIRLPGPMSIFNDPAALVRIIVSMPKAR